VGPPKTRSDLSKGEVHADQVVIVVVVVVVAEDPS
jgi:hypothetical protein